MTASVATPNMIRLGGGLAAFDGSTALGGLSGLSAGSSRSPLLSDRPADLGEANRPAPATSAPRRAVFQEPAQAPRARRFEHPVHRDVPVARPTRPVGPRPSVRPTPVRPTVTARPGRRRSKVVSLPASGSRSRSGRVAGLRLTRRGRILGLLIVAAVAYGAFGLGRASAVSDAPASRPQEVVVQPGDSLWTIAVRAMPDQDPRDAVEELKSLNHLSGAQVEAGEHLRVS